MSRIYQPNVKKVLTTPTGPVPEKDLNEKDLIVTNRVAAGIKLFNNNNNNLNSGGSANSSRSASPRVTSSNSSIASSNQIGNSSYFLNFVLLNRTAIF